MSEAPQKSLRSVVKGGAGAVGQGVIRALERRGDQVICLDLVEPDTAASNFILMDVADSGSVVAAMEEARQRLGGLDVLVHAAGILRPAAFLDISEEDMAVHLDVNLTGAFRVSQSAARMMIDHGGRILLITSIHGQIGVPERGAYAASKGGIASLARVMAAELARHRIRVVCHERRRSKRRRTTL